MYNEIAYMTVPHIQTEMTEKQILQTIPFLYSHQISQFSCAVKTKPQTATTKLTEFASDNIDLSHDKIRLIIGSDRRSETTEGKIYRCRSCVRSPDLNNMHFVSGTGDRPLQTQPTFVHPQTLTGVLIYFLSANYIWVSYSVHRLFRLKFRSKGAFCVIQGLGWASCIVQGLGLGLAVLISVSFRVQREGLWSVLPSGE